MRSVRPEEIQDTIGRKRGPFEDDAVGISSFFSFFLLRLDKIENESQSRDARPDLSRILSRTSFCRYTTNCLQNGSVPTLGSRECPTTVAARNCATPTIVFCACSAAFWKTYYTFDFVSCAKAKRSYFSPITKTPFILFLDIRDVILNNLCQPSNY